MNLHYFGLRFQAFDSLAKDSTDSWVPFQDSYSTSNFDSESDSFDCIAHHLIVLIFTSTGSSSLGLYEAAGSVVIVHQR